MAQAKKKAATKTAKKASRKAGRSGILYEKYQKGQKSNMFFVISMSFLAATLLFANLLFMAA